MVNGTLRDHLGSRDMESLSWKKRLEICVGAAKGLHYLHTGTKLPIFHRDVKPDIILLDNNMAPKLSQFGLSLQGKLSKSESDPIEVNVCGTLGFIAPEYMITGILTDKCDVYSFGMVLLRVISCTDNIYPILDKMYMLEKPNGNLEPMDDEIIDPILTRLISPECLAVFMNITKRCLNYEKPYKRPTMGEVEVELEHALALQEEAERVNSMTFLPATNGALKIL